MSTSADYAEIRRLIHERDRIQARIVEVHSDLTMAKGDNKLLRAEVERLRGENICDACAGDALADCMCRGTGKMSKAAVYLREQVYRLQAELEETKLEASKELMLRNEYSDRLQARVDELEKKEPKYLDKPCAHVTPCERKGLCTDER